DFGNLQPIIGKHAATVLSPSGKVLVVGGFFANTAIYDESTNQWLASGSTVTARESFSASPLLYDRVLVAGGWDGADVTNSAETFAFVPIGGTCTDAGECVSGFCVNGVCCNTACDGGVCVACSKTAGAIADGTCTGLVRNCDWDNNACTEIGTCQNGVCV